MAKLELLDHIDMATGGYHTATSYQFAKDPLFEKIIDESIHDTVNKKVWYSMLPRLEEDGIGYYNDLPMLYGRVRVHIDEYYSPWFEVEPRSQLDYPVTITEKLDKVLIVAKWDEVTIDNPCDYSDIVIFGTSPEDTGRLNVVTDEGIKSFIYKDRIITRHIIMSLADYSEIEWMDFTVFPCGKIEVIMDYQKPPIEIGDIARSIDDPNMVVKIERDIRYIYTNSLKIGFATSNEQRYYYDGTGKLTINVGETYVMKNPCQLDEIEIIGVSDTNTGKFIWERASGDEMVFTHRDIIITRPTTWERTVYEENKLNKNITVFPCGKLTVVKV